MEKIASIVIRGKRKAQTLGFPTANLALGKSEMESGVYVGKAFFEGNEYAAAVFVGMDRDVLEAHILDFEGDLYGKKIEVEVGQKLREAVKFESEKQLINQVLKDLASVRKANP
ncbi:MAG: riboflavin kinase [Candidatus Moranbacteria bacterium]|nr:riboflavin kinase [Candidatus Moranbacteria bacterium]